MKPLSSLSSLIYFRFFFSFFCFFFLPFLFGWCVSDDDAMHKYDVHANAGLIAPVPGMVAPGLMLPGPPMMPMIPRFRWSPAHGPLFMTAARANPLTNANPSAIAPISVIYTQLQQQPQPQQQPYQHIHHEIAPHILKQLQL